MKQMHRYFLVTIISLGFILSCSNKEAENNQYSFFVAGHVYGYPGESKDNIGVHPPFKKKLYLIRDNAQIEFGVFTGDIVEDGKNEMEWDELDADVLIQVKESILLQEITIFRILRKEQFSKKDTAIVIEVLNTKMI